MGQEASVSNDSAMLMCNARENPAGIRMLAPTSPSRDGAQLSG